MTGQLTRRGFLGSTALGAVASQLGTLGADDPANAETVAISAGNLKAVFRDNARSPDVLSGIDSLTNERDAPGFDAFDPDSAGASAGLNFEHIISGHESRHNAFSPRHGQFEISKTADPNSFVLVRRADDDPWSMSSTMKYTLVAPHYVDLDFRCVPHDVSRFATRGYAIFFFANYMNDVADVALNFRGIAREGDPEEWIRADAPSGHAHWNKGGTYRSVDAGPLEYDDDQKFVLNSWSYEYPRYTQPFYYGRAEREMTLILMFDKASTTQDEIRLSLFKFKVPKFPRPAWDFQYVIRQLEQGREYGFKARLVWKKFVSPEDCQGEFDRWRASL